MSRVLYNKNMKVKSFIFFVLILTAVTLIAPIFSAPLYTAAEATAHKVAYKNNAESAVQKKYWLANVKFSDSTDFEDDFIDSLQKTFTTSKQSVKEYFKIVSEGKYSVDAEFLTENASVTLEKTQNYYLPKYHHVSGGRYVNVNEHGYDNRYFDSENNVCPPEKIGAKRHIERLLRERELIKSIASDIDVADKIIDADGDGIIDGISFIVKTVGNEFSWDDILWPHRSALSGYNEELLNKEYYIPDGYEVSPLDFLPVKIGGKAVDGYTIFTTDAFAGRKITDADGNKIYSPSLICHEYMHDLGIADYYAYNGGGELYSDEPVGELDIMGGAGVLPQMPLTYTRLRLGFLSEENITPVYESGRYTLFPTVRAGGKKALKLVLNDYNKTGEYFMIEARENKGNFVDATLSDSGVVVYRINEKNAYYDFDGSLGSMNLGNTYGGNEVYVFRLNHGVLNGITKESYALLNGKNKKLKISKTDGFSDNSTIGNLDKSAYKTVIDKNSGLLVTSLCYENGQNSGILLSDIVLNADGSYSFDLKFDETVTGNFSTEITRHYNNKNYVVNWNGAKRNSNVKIYFALTDGLIRYKNEKYVLKKTVTPSMLESGEVYGNKVAFLKEVPAPYGQFTLPKISETAAVFVVSGDNVFYAGVMNPLKPTFSEYLFGTTKWLAMIISLLVILVVSVAAVVIYSVVKEKHRKSATEPEVDLSSVYGENYWMKTAENDEETEGDEENEAAETDALKRGVVNKEEEQTEDAKNFGNVNADKNNDDNNNA